MAHCPNCRLEVDESVRFCPECGTKMLEPVEAGDGLVGRSLNGKYRVLGLIGSGSMGTVYEGEHIGLRKKVALKILHPNLGVSDEELHRFQREGIAAGQFNHPNAIQIFDFDRAGDQTFYLAMEFVEGQTIRDYLAEEGPRSTSEAAAILKQVLSALGEAHRNGIVHRDLKPDNIMVMKGASENVTVKVLDFGMSKLVDRPMEMSLHTVTGRIIGTPLYMAPEQATGGDVDHRADLYAAGLVLFELLTGVRPFQGETITELFIRQASEPVPSLVECYPYISVPEGLDEVLGRALEKRREDRFQTAGEMLKALDGCMQNAPAKAGKRSKSRPKPKPLSTILPRPAGEPEPRQVKRRATYLVAGLVLISALGTAAWHFSGASSAPPPRITMRDVEDRTPLEMRYVSALQAARSSLLSGDVREAEKHVNQAHLMECRDSEAYLLRAEIFREMGDHEVALADYREALDLDPRYTAAATGIGWVQLERGETGAALESFRGAASRDADSAEALAGQGAALYRRGETDAARDLLEAATRKDSTCGPAHEWLGTLQLEAGEAQAALDSFVNAKRINRNSWRALAGLGAAYLVQDKYDEAERQLRNALLLEPEAEEALVDLAILLLRTDRPADALTQLDSPSLPDSGRIDALRGAALNAEGRTADAIAALQSAQEQDEMGAEEHTLLGILHHQQGDSVGALSQYRAALAIDDDLFVPHLNLGLLQFELGEYEQAETHFTAAYLIDTEAPLPHFWLGLIYMDYLPNVRRSLEHFELYHAVGGTDPRVLEWVDELNRY